MTSCWWLERRDEPTCWLSTQGRQSVIQQQCAVLHLPTVASQCTPLAEQAERERQPYVGYLEAQSLSLLSDRR
jgi:hypothetical protein